MLPGRKFDLMRNPKSRAATALLSFLAAAALSAQQAPIRAEAEPTVMADGSIFDAAYYAAAVGISEAALYQHYETFGKAEGRLPCDPEAEAYFLEGEPAETILPDPVYPDDEITQRILSLKAAFPEGLPWKGGSHLYGNLQFPTCPHCLRGQLLRHCPLGTEDQRLLPCRGHHLRGAAVRDGFGRNRSHRAVIQFIRKASAPGSPGAFSYPGKRRPAEAFPGQIPYNNKCRKAGWKILLSLPFVV